jgi:hypothetical protein
MNRLKYKCYNVVNGWNKWWRGKLQPQLYRPYIFASSIKYKLNFNSNNII